MSAPTSSPPIAKEEDLRASTASPLRVLVVDDDDESRRGLEKAVLFLGHECRSAKDGLEAWEMLQAARSDVILSDWNMPRLDGVELCRRVRAAEVDGTYTYFIFLTGFGDKDHFLRGMEAGADDYHAKPVDLDELRARLASAARVISLYTRLAEANSHLRRDSQTSFRIARVDPLTGVGNRLRMDEDLHTLWAHVQRYRHEYAAAMCDIDEFKKYNDHFGHLAGDEILRQIAQAIRKGLRQSDSLYRYGGEEFLVLLPEQTLAEAVSAMDRVRADIERLGIPTVTDRGVVTVSVGVAEIDARDQAIDGWIHRTDMALYRAKAAGRNRVEADR
jgi:two-component system cell cycle response regulator